MHIRVLYIAHSGELQGAGFALLNIVLGVKEAVSPIVLLPEEGPLYDKLSKAGIKCYVKKMYNECLPQIGSLYDLIFFIPRCIRIICINYLAVRYINRIIIKEAPDIIHTNTGVLHFVCSISKKNNIPHVWHLREFQTKQSGYYPICGEKRLVKMFRQPNNHCISITKVLFDYYNLEPGKDKTIYDGVFSSQAIQEAKLISPKKCKYFLYVGSIMAEKGVMDLISTFSVFCSKNNDCELWLAGHDWMNARQIVSSLPCSARIKFLGFRTDVNILMQSALATLVPSYHEGFGFVVAEAMLNHCLVIGRNTTGIKEQFDIAKQHTGIEVGFRFNNNNELLHSLVEIYNNQNSFDDKIMGGYETAASLYSTEQNLKNIISFYDTLVQEY